MILLVVNWLSSLGPFIWDFNDLNYEILAQWPPNYMDQPKQTTATTAPTHTEFLRNNGQSPGHLFISLQGPSRTTTKKAI
jgi:hypothetical protein